ncbi:MAG: peptidylprolyl isomerase [Ruminococcaceae bacterium]|nr:peptidylprolyl isomerase [Oscillospiraceae bacterium]
MKRITKAGCAALASILLLTGCSGSDNNENDSGDYGGIKTISTPDSFEGNAADINGDGSDVQLKSGDTYAVITIESYGEITCKLYPEAAPEGVQNFIDLANSGYYTGKDIHRVVKDFMMQGGSANGDGMSVDSDPSFNVEYNSKMRHFYGALCYANAGGINGSQFYIVNNKGFSDVDEASFESQLTQLNTLIDELNGYLEAAQGDEKAYYQSYYDYYVSMKNTTASNLRALKERTDEINAKYREVGGTPFLDGGYTVFGQAVSGFDVIDKISEVEVELQSSGSEKSHPVQKIVISSVEIKTAE